MSFVPATDYDGDVLFNGEIGRYESFSVALNHGDKRSLLGYRLHGIKVRVLAPMRPRKQSRRAQPK